jgi:hypothetical protein
LNAIFKTALMREILNPVVDRNSTLIRVCESRSTGAEQVPSCKLEFDPVYLRVLTICSSAREAANADVDKLAKTIADVPIITGTAGPPRTVMKAMTARAPNRMSATGV